jgi:hypothetical protein
MSATRSRFVADERVRSDPGLMTFLRQSPYVKVYGDGSPAQFVTELRRRWDERVAREQGERKTSESGPQDILPGTVFVSYASENRPLAKAVADALAKENIDVWFDQQQLASGDAYERKITSAIDRCAVFVPVISKAIADSRRFVFSEWRAAIEVAKKASFNEDTKFLMPVISDDIAPTDENVPAEFRKLHLEKVGPEGPTRSWVEEVRQQVRRFRKESKAGTA